MRKRKREAKLVEIVFYGEDHRELHKPFKADYAPHPVKEYRVIAVRDKYCALIADAYLRGDARGRFAQMQLLLDLCNARY